MTISAIATPLIMRNWCNRLPKENWVKYGSSNTAPFVSFWWHPTIGWNEELTYPLIPADQKRIPSQSLISQTLTHQLLFTTLLCWATDTPLPKHRILKGIGSPKGQSQAAALLGAWEDLGFLVKIGKGKTAAYKVVDGYHKGSWPNATNAQRKQCYQRILRNVSHGVNLSAVKNRARTINGKPLDHPEFCL